MSGYTVTVDRTACIACGVAPALCPQIFVLGDDNGKNKVVEKYSEKISANVSIGRIPEDLYDCAKQASDACPVQVIAVKKI